MKFSKNFTIGLITIMVAVIFSACNRESPPSGKVVDFADDSVIVVLTREATLQLREYFIEDFLEIGVSEIIILMTATDEYIISTPEVKIILLLKLSEPSKENVLKACEILNQRDDIEYAGPNHIDSRC